MQEASEVAPEAPPPVAGLAPPPALGVLLVAWLFAGLLLAFILLPLLQLVATPSLASLRRAAGDTDIASALGLSLIGAALAALLSATIGVPLAYLLARTRFPGRATVAAIADLPLCVPHTVAGIALLMVFGRRGLVGRPAEALFGLQFWGSLAGVVVAMAFVAVPYMVNAARIGFEAVDPRLEKVARTLGMGPWEVLLRITLPLAAHGIATGFALTFARAISEFGAVVILAYYPMTAPVRIYELFLRFGLDDAVAAAVLLLALSLALFVLFRHFVQRVAPMPGIGR
ncbi:MAG TPA: ABC transporter permease [Stellaceae bacterium]|nr:ABC transporter permease [Stellaceae bacterium]